MNFTTAAEWLNSLTEEELAQVEFLVRCYVNVIIPMLFEDTIVDPDVLPRKALELAEMLGWFAFELAGGELPLS